MTFFAYMALVSPSERDKQNIVRLLQEERYGFKYVSLAREFGAQDLYGIDVALEDIFEIELEGRYLLDGTLLNTEAALLDPEDPEARFNHYIACAQKLGCVVHDFRDSELVDAMYCDTPIDLSIVRLIRAMQTEVVARPIIINLDPDFELRLGRYILVDTLERIRERVWKESAFSDLTIPMRLVIDT